MAHKTRIRCTPGVIVFAFMLVVAACGSSGSETADPPIEPVLTVTKSGVSVGGVDIPVGEPTPVDMGVEIALSEGGHAFLILGFHEFELLLKSRFTLASVDSTKISAVLELGHLRFSGDPQSDTRLELITPNAVLTTVERGTEFVACQAPSALTCVDVSDGEVEWRSGGKVERIPAGQSAFARLGHPPEPTVCLSEEQYDEWLETARTEGEGDLGALVSTGSPCDDGEDGGDSEVQEGGIGAYSGDKIPTSVGMVAVSVEAPQIGTTDFQQDPDHYRERVTLDHDISLHIDEFAVSNEKFWSWLKSKAGDDADLWEEFAPDQWLSDAPVGAVTEASFPAGAESAPVVGVRPAAAEGFCTFTDKRLPTEIEWELSAVNGHLRDLGTVQEWVAEWDEYAPVAPAGDRVLRGWDGLNRPDAYYRLQLTDAADRPVSRADAGFRCASDVVEPLPENSGSEGAALLDEFCDYAYDWPTVVGDSFDLGYHPPCFYHVEVGQEHAQAVAMSGSALVPASIEVDVLIRNTADSSGNFRYGVMVGSGEAGYLILTVQPGEVEGSFFLDWCLQEPSQALIRSLAESEGRYGSYAAPEGVADRHAGEVCETGSASGRQQVEDLENTLRLDAAGGSVTISVDGSEVGSAPVSIPGGDVGLFVQNYHMRLAHLHFNRLTVHST